MSHKPKSSDGLIITISLVPDYLNCVCPINNLSFILRKDDDTSDFMPITRSSNIRFEDTYNSLVDYPMLKDITTSPKRNLKRGAELFEYYGSDWKFE